MCQLGQDREFSSDISHSISEQVYTRNHGEKEKSHPFIWHLLLPNGILPFCHRLFSSFASLHPVTLFLPSLFHFLSSTTQHILQWLLMHPLYHPLFPFLLLAHPNYCYILTTRLFKIDATYSFLAHQQWLTPTPLLHAFFPCQLYHLAGLLSTIQTGFD